MDGEPSSAQLIVMEVTAALSLASLFYLFQKHIGGSPLLKYEPRSRVPWRGAVAMLGMAMPLLGMFAFLAGIFAISAESPDAAVVEAVVEVEEKMSLEKQLIAGWANVAFVLVFVAGLIAVLVKILPAELRDFGLPTSWRQLLRDTGIGLLAALASLLPMFAIQLVLLNIWPPDEQHPLIEQLRENNTPAMMMMSFALAVIAAPLFEEFIFRGLFQGWLERCEDEAVGHTATLCLPLLPGLPLLPEVETNDE